MEKNYLNNEQFEEAAQLILILENPRHFRTAMGMEHNFEIIYAYSVGLAHYGDPRIPKSILYKYRYDENRNKKLNYTGTEKENISKFFGHFKKNVLVEMNKYHSENQRLREMCITTVADVVNREDHAELINGHLVVTDIQSTSHNMAVMDISSALMQFIEDTNGEDKVFINNVGLYCNELCDNKKNFFLPDVMTVRDKSGIKEDGVHTAPIFVAEVTSNTSIKQDYVFKMDVYLNIGVQEYWVVDLQRKMVVRYLPENEGMPEMNWYTSASVIPVQSYPGLEIDLSRIFE